MKDLIVGVMGPGKEATDEDIDNAEKLGKLIAQNNWILLNGGKNVGVMDAVNKGAKSENGITLGILSSNNKEKCSEYVDIPIVTGIGSARNNINVLSSDIIVACGIGLGTLSEIALAAKTGKKVILLNKNQESKIFLKNIGKGRIIKAENPEEAINLVKDNLTK